jgi:hypothetical protein
MLSGVTTDLLAESPGYIVLEGLRHAWGCSIARRVAQEGILHASTSHAGDWVGQGFLQLGMVQDGQLLTPRERCLSQLEISWKRQPSMRLTVEVPLRQ